MSPKNNSPSLASATLKGYTKIELPFTPNYSLDQAATQTDDARTVLLYKPNLALTNEPDKFTINFYNSDTANQYRLLVTGFTPDDRMVCVNRFVKKEASCECCRRMNDEDI